MEESKSGTKGGKRQTLIESWLRKELEGSGDSPSAPGEQDRSQEEEPNQKEEPDPTGKGERENSTA